MTIIDLGEVRGEAEREPSRRPPPAVGRPVRMALLAVLLVVSMVGAAPPQRRSGFTVPAGPTSSASVHGDRLFVLERGSEPDPRGGRLVAYRVPATGSGPLTPVWRTPLPAGSTAEGALVAGGVVLVTGGVSPDAPVRTTAFDVATGALRWEQAGAAFPAGDLLLLADATEENAGMFRSVEPATGRVRWSLRTPPESTTWRWASDGIDRLVVSSASGDVQVWDPRSGTRLAATNVRPGELPTYHRAQPVDDLLLVVRGSGTRITAYGLDELDRRWDAQDLRPSFFESCGALICGYGQTGGMWALDRSTGDVSWRTDDWHGQVAQHDGRLLVTGPSHTGGRQSLGILDTATGRTVAELGGWQLAGWYPPDGRLVGLRPAGAGRLLVADLDVAAGRTRPLDVVAGASDECQAGTALLLCRRGDDEYGIWRLPR